MHISVNISMAYPAVPHFNLDVIFAHLLSVDFDELERGGGGFDAPGVFLVLVLLRRFGRDVYVRH